VGWASKEVGGRPEEVVPPFRAMFPDARFVLIARDPRFIVRSIVLNRQRRGIELTVRQIAREWRAAMRLLRYFAEAAARPDVLVVRYEDLVEDPAREMARISAFLGIPEDPIHSVPTMLGQRARVWTSSSETTEVFTSSTRDWKAKLPLRARLTMQLCAAAWRVASGFAPTYPFESPHRGARPRAAAGAESGVA
jgi:hypothetical protein